MNRFKKELCNKGTKLAHQYQWLPFEQGGATLEDIIVNTELLTVTYVYTSIVLVDFYNRNMEIEHQEYY